MRLVKFMEHETGLVILVNADRVTMVSQTSIIQGNKVVTAITLDNAYIQVVGYCLDIADQLEGKA